MTARLHCALLRNMAFLRPLAGSDSASEIEAVCRQVKGCTWFGRAARSGFLRRKHRKFRVLALVLRVVINPEVRKALQSIANYVYIEWTFK